MWAPVKVYEKSSLIIMIHLTVDKLTEFPDSPSSDVFSRWLINKRTTWETLALSASGERPPAFSAVGVASFQLTKTTFQCVRTGDLLHHFTFNKMLSESERAGRGRTARWGTGTKRGRGSGCSSSSWDNKGWGGWTCLSASCPPCCTEVSLDHVYFLEDFVAYTSSEGGCGAAGVRKFL